MADDMKHVLANKKGIETVVGLLFFMGAMCPKCGHGTRAVSKKWRKCKQCGERVERRELPPAETPILDTEEPE